VRFETLATNTGGGFWNPPISIVTLDDVELIGGGTAPCNSPRFDADGDDDVDQDDFSVFQRCYGPGPLEGICRCMDRDSLGVSDGDVDQTDLVAFVNCANGPGMPAEPDCVP